MEEKFCKNCKWKRKELYEYSYAAIWMCEHEDATYTDMVAGLKLKRQCSVMRDTFLCGPEGKLFERKAADTAYVGAEGP